jgi:hypothetical protein
MRGRALLLVVLLLAAGAGGYALWRARAGTAGGGAAGGAAVAAADSAALAPAGVRVRVEVLNASRVRGLARRATMRLRDLGYDVVSSGNAGETRDSTLVLVRRGDAAIGERVARAMGGARVEARPDSSRYVDVSVLVGGAWRPPPGPLRP